MYINKKELLKLLPYFPAILIFISAIKLDYFFSRFNIKIVEYLSIWELVILFLDDIVYYTVYVGLVLLLSFLVYWKKHEESKEKEFEALKRSNPSKQFQLIWKKKKWDLFLLVAVIVSLFFNIVSLGYIIFVSIIIFVPIILDLIQIRHVEFYGRRINPTYYNIVITLTLLIGVMLYHTSNEIDYIKNGKFEESSITTTDSVIITNDSTIIYVGKTKEYVFLYDNNKQSSIIIPMSKINELRIHKKTKKGKRRN